MKQLIVTEKTFGQGDNINGAYWCEFVRWKGIPAIMGASGSGKQHSSTVFSQRLIKPTSGEILRFEHYYHP